MIVSINFDLFYQEVIIHSIIPNLVVMLIIKLEIKDITDTARSASYIGIQLNIESKSRLIMALYDKRTFHLNVVTF
jgi:hypothetical protein